MRDIFTNFRTASDGDLTATETTAGVYLGAAPLVGTPVAIGIPEMDDDADSLTITFEESAELAGTYRAIDTLQPVIDDTDQVPATMHIRINNKLDYVRMVFTVAGATPNFGAVTAGVDLGSYPNVLTGGPAETTGVY